MPYLVTVETGYRYTHQDYGSASESPLTFPGDDRRRRDHDHRVVFGLERPLIELSDRVILTAAYFGTFNRSNKIDFQYDRHIGSIGMEVRL
jgi:hypothetical protein